MSESSSAPALSKRPRGRSPAYPAIDLEKAIQRVRQLWSRDKQYPVPVANVAPLWGYANINGPAGLAVSALKKFGLVSGEGSKEDRIIMVTDLAVQILNHPSSDARAAAIKEAALIPPIHREMWEMYGSQLPSDANLTWRLVRERGFTDTGAREFLKEYRETIIFADLGEDDATVARIDDLEDEIDVPDETPNEMPNEISNEIPRELQMYGQSPETRARTEALLAANFPRKLSELNTRPSPLVPATQTYSIPIARQDRPPVIISGSFPLTAAEWDQFKTVLEAMKPVLVEDDSALPT